VLGMLRGMVVDDGLTILMITHKFREVMAFADEVTILRRGKLAGRGRVADLTPDDMARTMIGATNPREAAPGTIRGDLGILFTENLVHGSDSAESAAREIAIWFPGLD